ncbi:MAG: hypothetical protein IPO67_31285 [Deltaproteobacteria bacterium]|nr:hypothetical protein [Deltaproteobacteria bacterium]
MFAFLLSSLLLNPVHAAPLPASEFKSIAGAWVVTSTALPGGTCATASSAGSTSTYLWLVGASGTQEISVSVQGETGFPKMDGTYTSDGLFVAGLGPVTEGSNVYPMADFRLQKQADGTFTGTRRYHSVWPLPSTPGMFYACSVEYAVTAKKQ